METCFWCSLVCHALRMTGWNYQQLCLCVWTRSIYIYIHIHIYSTSASFESMLSTRKQAGSNSEYNLSVFKHGRPIAAHLNMADHRGMLGPCFIARKLAIILVWICGPLWASVASVASVKHPNLCLPWTSFPVNVYNIPIWEYYTIIYGAQFG